MAFNHLLVLALALTTNRPTKVVVRRPRNGVTTSHTLD
jgi:hypothetical protein